MRRSAFLIVFMLVSPLAAFSQMPTSVTVFGGYAYLHVSNGGFPSAGGPGYSLNGWDASIEGKIVPLIGGVADFGQQYGTPVRASIGSLSLVVHEHQTTALFGPQITIPGVPHVRPFAHALFGLDHVTDNAVSSYPGTFSASGNYFAMAFGGGIDIRLSGPIWIRPAQVDWVHVSISGGGVNEVRFSAGIVFHL